MEVSIAASSSTPYACASVPAVSLTSFPMSSPTRERRRDETLARFFLVLADRLILERHALEDQQRYCGAVVFARARSVRDVIPERGARTSPGSPRERRQQSRDRVHASLIVFGVREAELAIDPPHGAARFRPSACRERSWAHRRRGRCRSAGRSLREDRRDDRPPGKAPGTVRMRVMMSRASLRNGELISPAQNSALKLLGMNFSPTTLRSRSRIFSMTRAPCSARGAISP